MDAIFLDRPGYGCHMDRPGYADAIFLDSQAMDAIFLDRRDRRAKDAIFLDRPGYADAIFLDSQAMDAIFLDRPGYGCHILG